jgi:uncharacterized protein (DUF4213/DUF364 family)
MSIKNRLRDLAADDAAKRRAVDVRLGLTYTAVKLDDGRAGVAYCFGNRLVSGCSVFRGARPLAGRPASQLVEYLLSDDLLECSVGLATVNALVNRQPPAALPGDVLEAVNFMASDRVGMIGFFGPLVPALESRVAQLDIFEEGERLDGVCRPAEEAFETLPRCDVAIITSTAIVNGTIDRLLEVTKNCRETVLLGSSTPLLPKAFEGTSVSWLSGIVVHDADGILRTVSEGGGTVFFKPYVTKHNLPCREDFYHALSRKNTHHHIGR